MLYFNIGKRTRGSERVHRSDFVLTMKVLPIVFGKVMSMAGVEMDGGFGVFRCRNDFNSLIPSKNFVSNDVASALSPFCF